MEEYKYPIGREVISKNPDAVKVTKWINEIDALPRELWDAVTNLSEKQLNTPYRDNGWTVRQVVHHIADSHVNGYCRVKRILTEEVPEIPPYRQDSWAELADNKLAVTISATIIKELHKRWVTVLKSLNDDELSRELIHPKFGQITLKQLIGHYVWHGNHHLAQITTLTKRKNWSS